MIPAIGYMIGFYIITKMLELVDRKNVRVTPKIFAVITIIVCLFSLAALFFAEFLPTKLK